MLLREWTIQLEAKAGIKLAFQLILLVSLMLNVLLATAWVTADRTVRDIFIPPHIEKSFWFDGKTLGSEYLEQMGHWIVQQHASATPSSVSYQNSLLLKYVHPTVYGQLAIRLEVAANKLKQENMSTYFMPREVRISEKGQAVAFVGIQSTWISDRRASDLPRAYIVKFDYNGGKTYIKELRETDPRDPLNAVADAGAYEDEVVTPVVPVDLPPPPVDLLPEGGLPFRDIP